MMIRNAMSTSLVSWVRVVGLRRRSLSWHTRVALAAVDHLSGIMAARPAGSSSFDALAVDGGRCHTGLTFCMLSIDHPSMLSVVLNRKPRIVSLRRTIVLNKRRGTKKDY